MTSYRYPNETAIFWATIILLFIAFLISAGTTICLIPVAMAIFIVIAYITNQNAHRALLQQGVRVSEERLPSVAALAQDCVNRLKPDPVDIIIIPQRQLNAYTFGLSNPKVVVLFDALFKVMDGDEMRFILGHELGHVALGHTWLNTLLGGMAGVPPSMGAAVLFTFSFRWWNRACEVSADRAGILACGNPRKAISALIKLEAGGGATLEQLEGALKVIEEQDDLLVNVLAETLSSHPMTVHRIEKIKQWAGTAEYRRLQAEVNTRSGNMR
jgi:Zn-dependent protease with chaperone function